jgi:hypothetical protein
MHPASISLSLLLVFSGSFTGKVEAEFDHQNHTAQFKHVDEWSKWKTKHTKVYSTAFEELERHIIWQSNKKYIDHHNANSHIFGFTLAMNHLGDVVSAPYSYMHA